MESRIKQSVSVYSSIPPEESEETGKIDEVKRR